MVLQNITYSRLSIAAVNVNVLVFCYYELMIKGHIGGLYKPENGKNC